MSLCGPEKSDINKSDRRFKSELSRFSRFPFALALFLVRVFFFFSSVFFISSRVLYFVYSSVFSLFSPTLVFSPTLSSTLVFLSFSTSVALTTA